MVVNRGLTIVDRGLTIVDCGLTIVDCGLTIVDWFFPDRGPTPLGARSPNREKMR
jgi:hypothetical protein